MVFHLLHTVMPAMDSRFTEAAKKLSVALGNREGVSCVLLVLFERDGHELVC